MEKPEISLDDFKKLDLRVGMVIKASLVPGSEKLLELTVDFGSETSKKTIYSGISQWYEPESLVGRRLIFVVNLAPKHFKIAGVSYESRGMLLASGTDEAVLYTFDKEILPGEVVH